MSWMMAIELLLGALVLSLGAGALAGMKLGGKDLGYGLAAMMGGFFGPTAVLPAAAVGVALLCWLK